ncbi:hypothetical protein X765_32190 [Mesorhizobium sp. LSHC440B00]|nr:hypothetical protein X765_32190 [Mesorhizobium sp. LSHC440B00]
MDEIFSLAGGSRLVRLWNLTSVMRRQHADEQRDFDCLLHFPSALRTLSLTTIFGLPRSIMSRSSSRATLTSDRDVSATDPRHSRAVVDDGQYSEATAIGQLIRHEVQ